MGLQEFQDLLDRYGGDLQAWPPDRGREAFALVERSPEAYRLLEEMRQVELMLETVDAPEPNPQAIDRVMDRIRDHENQVADARFAGRKSGIATQAARSPLREVMDVLGGLVYRPVILFVAVSLVGVLVGVVDRASYLQEIQGDFLYFMMNP